MNLSDICSKDDFYTIKLFLAQWDTNFYEDISLIDHFKYKGCRINKTLYKAIVKRFEPLLPTKRVLDTPTKQNTFKLYIDYPYKHDELHQHFAYYYQPLYKSILKRPNSIYTSEIKFKALSDVDQFKCALEEIYTVATERLIIPYGYSPFAAKSIALKRLCIGLSKGYFCIYLLENFYDLLYSDDSHFEKRLKELGEYEIQN